MLDKVTFEHVSEDGLASVRWSFYLLYQKLVVDSYVELARESKRKKFTAVRSWSRLNRRENTMPMAAVPLTDAIAQEAQEQFIQELKTALSVGFQQ